MEMGIGLLFSIPIAWRFCFQTGRIRGQQFSFVTLSHTANTHMLRRTQMDRSSESASRGAVVKRMAKSDGEHLWLFKGGF